MSWPPSGDAVARVPSGVGVEPSGFRGLLLSVLPCVWCCGWLSTECCGLADDDWEDSGDADGSCAPWGRPWDVDFAGLLDQALGGGGGGAPGRGIGWARETGSS